MVRPNQINYAIRKGDTNFMTLNSIRIIDKFNYENMLRVKKTDLF